MALRGFGVSFQMRGGIGAFIRRKGAAAQPAVRAALKTAAEGTKTDFRAAGARAGLGQLARAWQVRGVDRGGFDIVYYVTPKGRGAIKALAAFTRRSGSTIVVPRRGKYLAIPLPAAGPAAGRPKNIGGAPFDVRRLDPQRWEAQNKIRLYPWPAGRPKVLMAYGVRLDGRGVAVPADRGHTGPPIAIFVLVRRATLRARFDWRVIAETWKRRLPALVAEEWNRRIDRGDDGKPA